MVVVFRVLGDMSSSTESEYLLEKFTNNYHTIHVHNEPPVSKYTRSYLKASEDICKQAMSSVGGN